MPIGVYVRKLPGAMLGRHHTEETKRKISLIHKGKIVSEETKKRMSIAKIGVRRPDLIGNKLSIGRKISEEQKRAVSLTHKGKPKSNEQRKKMSEAQRGEKNHQWQGGKTSIKKRIRSSNVYMDWRTSIFLRDNRTCVLCGSKKQIEADHYPIPISAILTKLIIEQGLENLFEKALEYNLLWIIENGRTLCHECHTKTETYGNKQSEQRLNNL